MDAKQYLIQEFKNGNCEDITSNPDPDFCEKFYHGIICLMERYAFYQADGLLTKMIDWQHKAESWQEQFKDAIREVKTLQQELNDANDEIRNLEYELRSK